MQKKLTQMLHMEREPVGIYPETYFDFPVDMPEDEYSSSSRTG